MSILNVPRPVTARASPQRSSCSHMLSHPARWRWFTHRVTRQFLDIINLVYSTVETEKNINHALLIRDFHSSAIFTLREEKNSGQVTWTFFFHFLLNMGWWHCYKKRKCRTVSFLGDGNRCRVSEMSYVTLFVSDLHLPKLHSRNGFTGWSLILFATA